MVADNEHSDLPGIVAVGVPSENLLWVLLGFDMDAATFPKTQRFNAEECWQCLQRKHMFCFNFRLEIDVCFSPWLYFARTDPSLRRLIVMKPGNAMGASRQPEPGKVAGRWASMGVAGCRWAMKGKHPISRYCHVI